MFSYETAYNFLRSKIFKFLTVIIVSLNGYLIFCFSNDEHKQNLASYLGKFGENLVNFSGWFVFFTLIIGGIFPILLGWLQEKVESKNKTLSYSLILLETIEAVVERKRKLYANAVKDLQGSPTYAKVFNTITHPKNQIDSLIDALDLCFKKLYPDQYFKIALMSVKNNCLEDWIYFLPYTAKPNTDISDLKHPDSTISHALRLKEIVVVEDVQQELKKEHNKKYIKGSTKQNENWSQLCYPIKSISSNEVIFIICIGARKENFFTNSPESLESYEWLLSFFSSRLALEHSLAQLKERAR